MEISTTIENLSEARKGKEFINFLKPDLIFNYVSDSSYSFYVLTFINICNF